MAEYIERTEEVVLAMNAGARAIETLALRRVLARKAGRKEK